MASRVDGETIQRMSEDGLEDFVSIAKEIEELIISQIESEDGLVRRYMNADLKMQMLLSTTALRLLSLLGVSEFGRICLVKEVVSGLAVQGDAASRRVGKAELEAPPPWDRTRLEAASPWGRPTRSVGFGWLRHAKHRPQR